MFKETCGNIFGQVRFAVAVAGCGRGCSSRAGKILPAHRGLRKYNRKNKPHETCHFEKIYETLGKTIESIVFKIYDHDDDRKTAIQKILL